MNVLHPKFKNPTNREDFIDYISRLENENVGILSGTYFEEFFHKPLKAFKDFDTCFGNAFFSKNRLASFSKDQWCHLSNSLEAIVQCSIKEKYKHYLASGGEDPVHPILAEIFDWELALELMGPIPSTCEMEQMLDSCPSRAAPSYYMLWQAHYEQCKEAA